MEITRHNFRENLQHLQQVVNDAQFFAIDTEFTGLNCYDRTTVFDTPAEYFAKVQENTQGYIIVQYGITAFFVGDAAVGGGVGARAAAGSKTETAKAIGDTGPRFRYESFNFYVCPRSRKQTFRCQGESLAFLASHNFDFNKLFRDGISFCDMSEATELRQQLNERTPSSVQTAYANEAVLIVPKEEQEFMQTIRESMRDFLASDEQAITVEHCNAFRRKLVYQLIEQEFAEKLFASPRKLPNSSIKVIEISRKKNKDEEKQFFVDKLQQETDEMEDYIGFTTVLTMLSESKKLIIGHNMFLDMLYSMRQFVAPAAQTLADFKRITHKMFPALLDTKYLCAQDCLKKVIPSSALGDIFESVSKKPFVLPDIQPVVGGFSYANVDGQMHDAGYDSYMTGVAFISMALHLNILPSELQARSHKLKNLVNKLFIMRLADICYIDLTGKEPQPNRDHVFCLTVPSHWKHPNIVQQFRNYGNVNSSWPFPNVAYVALQQREHAYVVMPTIRLAEGVTIATFADFQLRRQAEARAAANAQQHNAAAVASVGAHVAKQTTLDGDPSCRPTNKRNINEASGDVGIPTTNSNRADGSETGDVDMSASKSINEQILTKKPKLNKTRTEQAVFKVDDNWE